MSNEYTSNLVDFLTNSSFMQAGISSPKESQKFPKNTMNSLKFLIYTIRFQKNPNTAKV